MKRVDFRREKKVNLVISVDPQLERHSSSKLVSVTSHGNVVGVDLALDIDILIGSNVKELDGNQRLRVVHLQKKISGTALTTGANVFSISLINYLQVHSTAMFTK